MSVTNPPATLTAEELMRWTYASFERVALVASFQAESGVLIDMACRLHTKPEVLTIDTGRLPQQTHDVMAAFQQRYPIRLRVLSPDPEEVETMTRDHGVNLFRDTVAMRTLCCDVRKARPLARALRGYDAWITGVRREQAATRAATAVVAEDAMHGGIAKIAPLAGWSRVRVHGYLEAHGIPRNALYDSGYSSIGCAPCTRATVAGEDERAGRWWWERDASKECGLHRAPAVVPA